MNWHSFSINEIFSQLETSSVGLSAHEAQKRLIVHGHNNLPRAQVKTIFTIFIKQFTSPLIYLLITAAIISWLTTNYIDALFISLILLVNASMGTLQEWQAEKASRSLQYLITPKTRIKRNNKEHSRSANTLVPGDIVFLESGSQVPADMRLFELNDLIIDESLLTGESIPVQKQLHKLNQQTPLTSRTNMAYAGTMVIRGRAWGIVVTTGLNTQIGAIAQSVLHANETKTPLIIRLEIFSKNIALLILLLCTIVFIVGVLYGHHYNNLFLVIISLMVAAIPEGLPIAITVALARGAYRMAQRNVIIRQLSAVEGLGSCTCIASDKTGTLTINKQTIVKIILPSGKNYNFNGHNGHEDLVPELIQLSTIGVISNEALLTHNGKDWEHHGDDVDLAFLTNAHKLGLDLVKIRRDNQQMKTIPFESERRYTAAFFSHNNQLYLGVKGAFDTILPYCTTMLVDNTQVLFDRTLIETQCINLTKQGYRVLAVTQSPATQKSIKSSSTRVLNNHDITLIGIVAMIDPLRPEAKDAVKKAQHAGITVIMITGDHPTTALTIAKELGIAQSEKEVMTGLEFSKQSQKIQTYPEKFRHITVFARVTPLQKLEIVRLRKILGDFVAVTGDGVNDAPALKEAHVGIAMGTGSDVAKNTAQSIISDNNFASIVNGIYEGRIVYANIRKVIYLLATTGCAEIAFTLISIVLGLPIPLLAVQFLWLNLVTNGIQEISLTFEPGEPHILNGLFYKPHQRIFDKFMIIQVLFAGLFIAFLCTGVWAYLLHINMPKIAARTIVFFLFVLLQNLHVLNCRSERTSIFNRSFFSNKLLLACIIIANIIHVTVSHIPVLQKVLRIQPIPLASIPPLVLLASSIIVMSEFFKRYFIPKYQ